jgi:hypothetical protein
LLGKIPAHYCAGRSMTPCRKDRLAAREPLGVRDNDPTLI